MSLIRDNLSKSKFLMKSFLENMYCYKQRIKIPNLYLLLVSHRIYAYSTKFVSFFSELSSIAAR